MDANFSTVVEEIQNLPIEDQLALRDLLDKYLIESRRGEMFQNYLEAKELVRRGELKFTNDVDELRRSLEE